MFPMSAGFISHIHLGENQMNTSGKRVSHFITFKKLTNEIFFLQPAEPLGNSEKFPINVRKLLTCVSCDVFN